MAPNEAEEQGGTMRYKKHSIDKLLAAMEAETLIGRQPGNLAAHLCYIHRLVHEIEDALYRSWCKPEKKGDMSAIEYIFQKLAYE